MTNEEKQALKAKNKKVKDKVKNYAPNGGPFAVAIPGRGQVTFETLGTAEDQEGVEFVEVYLQGDTELGDPHYKVYNPPTHARMPDGSLRDDPVLALAELLSRHGGRQKGVRR